ncbi:TrmH family RNA methyltransferase [Agrococcus sp. SGAir0287]|uniref:TrmH family RNA methyltransferase n=1 Tax=Agrococcus sp. SGAir0287 TaxID=2070347 RepID=UPI0010CD181E|nr:RNA methyltransferase [Agrococcus sp. SGAir0287]QCR19601.1 RNA methyltransferase [Agrococcus sp. SGAir0287]
MIESPRHERVRAASRLQQRAARSETGLFLLEGPNALREAIAADAIVEAFATTAFVDRHGDLAASLGDALELVGERALAAMSDTVRPQGVVAVCRQQPTTLERALERATLVAILHEVQDPGNLGTILRVADAAGADAVVVTRSSVDPYNPKVVRATTGSILHIPHAVGVSTEDAVLAAHQRGLQVLAADVSGDELTAPHVRERLARPTAWLFGNEARGLDVASLALADLPVRVPIYGRAESLNLATAASVCLYQSAIAHADG